jgi:putative transposase
MNPSLDRPTAVYERFFQPGIYFVTCWAVKEERIFEERIFEQRATAHLVRSVLHEVKDRAPFTMLGFVILPDHLHLLIRPEANTLIGAIVDKFRRQYYRSYLEVMGIPGDMEIWDQRRRVEPVADVSSFAHKLDMIHYDPVQHGLAQRPEQWDSSSYASWIDRGLYKLGWGWQKPARLHGG